MGIVKENSLQNSETVVITHGIIDHPNWNWDSNKAIFLSINGDLIQVKPSNGFSLMVGFPLTAQMMFFRLNHPVKISI